MEFRNSRAGTSARRYTEPTRQQSAITNDRVSTTTGGGGEASIRTMQTQNSGGKFPKLLVSVITAAVVILVLVVVGCFVWSHIHGNSGNNGDKDIKSGQYQAVFLTN